MLGVRGAEASLGTEIVIFRAKRMIQAMALEKETLQNNAVGVIFKTCS